VGGLHRIGIKVQIRPDGAAHGVCDDRLFPQAHFIDYLGDDPVYNPVAAAAAVFGGNLV
jgi:hypothetical protein